MTFLEGEFVFLPVAQRARSVTGCTWWVERLLVRIPAPLRSRLLSLKKVKKEFGIPLSKYDGDHVFGGRFGHCSLNLW
jgi:hypothetical protein